MKQWKALTPGLPRLFHYKLAKRCSCRPALRCIERVALASLQTLASVRSGANVRVRNFLECGQAALWRPRQFKTTPHSHLASVTGNGTRNLPKINTRKTPESILNPGLVGHARSTYEQPLPEVRNGDEHDHVQTLRTSKELELGSGSRVVLPTVCPFTRFGVCRWRWSCSI